MFPTIPPPAIVHSIPHNISNSKSLSEIGIFSITPKSIDEKQIALSPSARDREQEPSGADAQSSVKSIALSPSARDREQEPSGADAQSSVKSDAKLLGQPLSIDLQDIEFLVTEPPSVHIPATQPEIAPKVVPESLGSEKASPVEPVTVTPTGSEKASPVEPVTVAPTVSANSATLPTSDAKMQTSEPNLSPIAQVPEGFTVFPVGINIGGRNVNEGVSVRGQENSSKALDLEHWLLPYDAVVQALKLSTKVLPDNQIELRSPSLAVRIDPAKLHTDPKLGLVFSVGEVRSLFGVQVEFDLKEYAIVFDAPWLTAPEQSSSLEEAPVQLEGLPRIASPDISLAAIEQGVSVSGGDSTPTAFRGDLTAVGSILGGSWFVRADQPKLFSSNSWRITDALFQRQTDANDYFVGTQPPFWQNLSPNDYVGFTFIQRQGYTPPPQFYGESDPRQRLQAAQVGRTVSGQAEPGTLVRLVKGFSDRIIAETLVDSSGVYRFENLKLETPALGGYYQVFLYPKGQLTAQPEIRDATFSNLAGQLPAGASALIVSGGVNRDYSKQDNNNLFGDFSTFRGGIAQRWGVSNSVTLGAGTVYDRSLRGLAELFWQPENVPFKAAVSVLSGSDNSAWDINADVSYDPSQNFSARFTHDRFSSRLDAYWQLAKGITLLGNTNSNDATSGGIQLNFSGRDSFTFARLTFDTKSHLRWNLIQRLGKLELNSIGNEISSQSALSFYLGKHSDFTTGHSFVLGYDTYNQNRNDDLVNLAWRYRSKERSIDGTLLWEAQLGYGIGSRGSGVLASVGTTIIPGVMLRARYQGVSVTTGESTFGIELVSGLNLQGGITPGDRHANYLRTQGGILVQPFFDRNNNGQRDAGEEFYTDPNLVTINNQMVQAARAQVDRDRILVRLLPNTYRLDLDAAGLPPDWQAATSAYAVKVVAGSYTPVLVPLVPAYSLSGIVTDSHGTPLSGVRVEAIQVGSGVDSGQRLISVTNDAGVYFIEHLRQSSYTLQVNGKSIQPSKIKLTETSPPFQELNLQQLEISAVLQKP
ncbi:carboxypeptidase regulatory-like domain-containing protein [Nostoc sp. DedSLP04]|uniref:carboxypeptidase regulatory-like domain-containing protein n=1 Tax=Nostoc sp. DedSLP04 TaxID=3075401 RepID=UPI002AD4FB38|nr:carboxypeptidase regulatory-like domain-containing protein [Nostoc sp. DedSLP04]MDZ8029511.1 carboxypeptidase regulatory-like domain-containing protein [Nostoc sp. DedSLP04]